ncbi:hypothetical protein [Micromonospora echinofusca]|uniref:Uncharacterized protein n=1 Tax=Micromonospora echinofusca TaxID=47858 RepID=A0A1C5GBA9_MICEH|nr:hypothetical protein [Micromonospora echinofusca]SCG17007.1 hypothetical protein GA0070610_3309 [Micromonospora echinofusca]
MSDSYPPYGGQQPDPNVTPWSGPPAPQQGGYPGYGQPAQAPQFGAPFPPPKKSNKGLIIGLVAGAVVLVLAICGAGIGLILVNGDDDEPITVATAGPSAGPGASGTPGTDASPTPGQQETQEPNNNAVTARYSSDLSNVCEGGQILNAAPYNGPTGAKAYTFSNNPDRPNFWSTKSVASNKPYYAKSADFETVSVVGCLKFVEGSEGAPKKCQYKDSAGKQVTIDYISSRYTLTFYAAKTGEKIGDGGTITAPAARCPSFISYNKTTMKSHAAPDSGSIEAALDKFLS